VKVIVRQRDRQTDATEIMYHTPLRGSSKINTETERRCPHIDVLIIFIHQHMYMVVKIKAATIEIT